MTLNSSRPTPYACKNHGDSFVFTTDYKLTYEIYYTERKDYLPSDIPFAPNTKVFGFQPIGTTFIEANQHKFDDRVAATLIDNIKDRFKNKDVILLYVCYQDGFEQLRSRLFNWWFIRYNTDLKKVDIASDNHLFISILYHPDNVYRVEIEQTIPELSDKWT